MTRQIYAHYDDDGIFVYQAFKPSTVAAALKKGTFGQSFSLNRMTWIKPSFGWMLYRSGHATKPGQEAILKIKIAHDGFLTILRRAVKSSYNPDPSVHANRDEWKQALNASDVRHQWDPDRDLHLRRLDRRAIQIGIRGEMVYRYVNEWIIGLEEVTGLAHAIKQAVEQKLPLPDVPEERHYPVDADLQHRLGMIGND